jgi:hypothetical protein
MSSKTILLLLLPFLFVTAWAQTNESSDPMAQVLKRLDALENENRRLASELSSLKQELAATRQAASPVQDAASLEERADVSEKRIDEQAQTKVESSQKFPISLNGMLLFNASTGNNASLYSSYLPHLDGAVASGATLGQSIIGLQFQGPSLPGGGRVNGSLTMDFWGGGAPYAATSEGWFRIREADISLDWKRRSLTFGQLKPLISPLQPTSLAEVAISPLAGAGNLWLWLPQVRYEERWRLNAQSGVNLQGALLQTDESASAVPMEYAASLESARPAFEGRAAFWHQFDEVRKLEIGAAFHTSTTHVAGLSVPSHIAAFDWSISPLSKLQWTGSFYRGQNVASLGSLGNGFNINENDSAQAIHTTAGWNQLAFPLTSKLTFHLFGGIESDNGSYAVTRNFTYAANFMYHLGPNVVFSAEALQSRLTYFNSGRYLANRYTLALAYLF